MGKQTQNPMIKVIESGLMGIHDTTNALARILRILIFQSSINAAGWHTLLSLWRDKLSTFGKPNSKIASLKGNITQTLAKPNISWNLFLKGIAILGYTKMEIDITLWKRGKPTKLDTYVIEDVFAESNIED